MRHVVRDGVELVSQTKSPVTSNSIAQIAILTISMVIIDEVIKRVVLHWTSVGTHHDATGTRACIAERVNVISLKICALGRLAGRATCDAILSVSVRAAQRKAHAVPGAP